VPILLALVACGCGDSSDGSAPAPTVTPTPTASARATPTATSTPPPNLVAEGARLFFQETFAGNGRTCGTCHPAQASFTLAPDFIATLPPDDPLFVAERDPALAGLEHPALLRSRALVLVNLDGFDRPPVFRGVPHIFSLQLTAPFGWSGESGALREFATRAVIQHFPRTLARVPGTDFRLPTEQELDALEAFMLSLPLPADLSDVFGFPLVDLGSFVVTPAQQRGLALFFGEARCSFCHGGALLTDNSFFNTGVASRPVNVAPPPECDPPCDPLGPREAGGARAFNTPMLFGLGKTAPFFHDNSAATLRDAVAHYASREFGASPGGELVGNIQLREAEIDDLVAFLEALTPCGNGVADHGEPCDDGNLLVGDGCRPSCTEERCGDGIVDPGEECDDANRVGGDGCDPTCRRR
jgi:cysteine-rich repeat protein